MKQSTEFVTRRVNKTIIKEVNSKKDNFIKELRQASKFIRHESFDDAMLYSIMHRVLKEVNDLSKVKIVKCQASDNILTKLTYRKFIKYYNTEKVKGIKMMISDPKPVWGFPMVGHIVSVLQYDDENTGGKLLFKHKSIKPEYDKNKIYVVLVKKETMKNLIIDKDVEGNKCIHPELRTYDTIHENNIEYSLAFIKSDSRVNNRI